MVLQVCTCRNVHVMHALTLQHQWGCGHIGGHALTLQHQGGGHIGEHALTLQHQGGVATLGGHAYFVFVLKWLLVGHI